MRVIDELTRLNKIVRDCNHTLDFFERIKTIHLAPPVEEVERVRKAKAAAEQEREFIEKSLQRRSVVLESKLSACQ